MNNGDQEIPLSLNFPSITRRSFIKRTSASVVVTALALDAFRDNSRAAENTEVDGQYATYYQVTNSSRPPQTFTGGTLDSVLAQVMGTAQAYMGLPNTITWEIPQKYRPYSQDIIMCALELVGNSSGLGITKNTTTGVYTATLNGIFSFSIKHHQRVNKWSRAKE